MKTRKTWAIILAMMLAIVGFLYTIPFWEKYIESFTSLLFKDNFVSLVFGIIFIITAIVIIILGKKDENSEESENK